MEKRQLMIELLAEARAALVRSGAIDALGAEGGHPGRLGGDCAAFFRASWGSQPASHNTPPPPEMGVSGGDPNNDEEGDAEEEKTGGRG